MKKTAEQISNFLKQEFGKRNKTKAILGISGGIDSAVAGFLCQKAGLDLYAVILPYKKEDIKDSEVVVKALGLAGDKIILVNIASVVDAQIKEFKMELDKIDKGNIMARQRMIVQYALARKLNGLVVGTENLSEYYLGYFTLHGDQACDISPISGLWKIQVRELARYLGLPDSIIEKAPSAGLWSGQTDEKEFGFSYKEADQIMQLSILEKNSEEEIIEKGFNQELVTKVLDRVKSSEYKRENPPKLLFN